jgi:hypothetical protein
LFASRLCEVLRFPGFARLSLSFTFAECVAGELSRCKDQPLHSLNACVAAVGRSFAPILLSAPCFLCSVVFLTLLGFFALTFLLALDRVLIRIDAAFTGDNWRSQKTDFKDYLFTEDDLEQAILQFPVPIVVAPGAGGASDAGAATGVSSRLSPFSSASSMSLLCRSSLVIGVVG